MVRYVSGSALTVYSFCTYDLFPGFCGIDCILIATAVVSLVTSCAFYYYNYIAVPETKMGSEILESLLGLKLPQEIPTSLVISIVCNSYSENEARTIMADGGETAETIDRWIRSLRDNGFFSNASEHNTSEQNFERTEEDTEHVYKDGSMWLWNTLKTELRKSENSVKHRLAALDVTIKHPYYLPDVKFVSNYPAEDIIPFSEVNEKYPWAGCKFAATVILLLVSRLNGDSKRAAIRPFSHKLGGCSIPSRYELEQRRCPYRLAKTFKKAIAEAEISGKCTALSIQFIDVEIMRNPSKNRYQLRPGTFSHSCVMTISPSGVYIFQAYGPRGYTLLQHIEDHDDSFPMTLADGETWVQRFEEFASQPAGMWTEKTNDAYLFCFGVDLISFGNMKLGSQLDAYYIVDTFPFDKTLVQSNWALLPKPKTSYPNCNDSLSAKSLPKQKFKPDGGVTHYYIPIVRSCGNMLCKHSVTIAKMRCAACKCIYYCSRDCQVEDWSHKHKNECKMLKQIQQSLN